MLSGKPTSANKACGCLCEESCEVAMIMTTLGQPDFIFWQCWRFEETSVKGCGNEAKNVTLIRPQLLLIKSGFCPSES